MGMNPPTVRAAATDPNYVGKHVGGTVLAGLAGALGVLLAIGGIPTSREGWAAIALPCLAAALKSIQSYNGGAKVAP